MDKIIAISGKQFAGKDTLCQLLLKYLPDYRRVALADALKDEYAETTGILRKQVDTLKAGDPRVRGELIALGKRRREKDQDYWIKKVLEQPGNKIVTDLRFLNELERFLEYKAFTIRIEAKRDIRAKRGKLGHETDSSETELDSVTSWRFIIHNNSSIEALDREAKQIARNIKTDFGEYCRPLKQTMSFLDGLLPSFWMDMERFCSRQVERFAKYLRT